MWKRQGRRSKVGGGNWERDVSRQSIGQHSDIASLMLFLLGIYDPSSPGHDIEPIQQDPTFESLPVVPSRCAEPMQHCRESQRPHARIDGVIAHGTSR